MQGFCINLKERKDRYNHFENLKKKYSFFCEIERFEAIKLNNGWLGCSMSHYKALMLLLHKFKYKEKYVMMCEDDLYISNETNFNNFIINFNLIKDFNDWDIITLTPRGNTMFNYDKFKTYNFKRIIENQTTTAYIIKIDIIDKLLNYLKIGIINMVKYGVSAVPKNTCDQIWKPMQEKYVFLYFKDIFAGQLQDYSDIEKKFTNYNNAYYEQKNK